MTNSNPQRIDLFSQYMGIITSWESSNNPIAANATTGNYVYRDANGILTDKYGNTSGTAAQMLARTEAEATRGHYENFFLKPGIDKLPVEIQAQLFDISINGGPARATDILGKVLAKAGDKYKNMPAPEAAALYLQDVGMAEFNNRLAAERVAFYDDLARRNPAKAVNLNGWHRRAAGFIMDKSVDEYQAAGFKIVDGKPMLPDQVQGTDNKPAVRMPDGTLVPYDKWYGDNVIAPARNDRAKFDERRQKAIRYSRPTGLPSNWGDEDSNAPVPMEDWSPEDRALFNLVVGILGAIFKSAFAAASPPAQQPMPQLAYSSAEPVFGMSAPTTPSGAPAQSVPIAPRLG